MCFWKNWSNPSKARQTSPDKERFLQTFKDFPYTIHSRRKHMNAGGCHRGKNGISSFFEEFHQIIRKSCISDRVCGWISFKYIEKICQKIEAIISTGRKKIFSMKWNTLCYGSAMENHFHGYTNVRTECRLNKSGRENKDGESIKSCLFVSGAGCKRDLEVVTDFTLHILHHI